MADRAALHSRRYRDAVGVTDLARRFITRHGDIVKSGPFAGLRYAAEGDTPIAKLLGVYEDAVQKWLAEELRGRPETFINLGSGDGYYAVGVKLASPRTV